MKIHNDIVLPKGYRAGGMYAGIKRKKVPDLTLLLSDEPAAVAGTFTTNLVTAAPVKVCKKRIGKGRGRAVIANSGNANCCTGARGVADAEAMANAAAKALGIPAAEVFVSSTGSIGKPLPMDVIIPGIGKLAKKISPDGGPSAARGIMTTDSGPKTGTVRMKLGGKMVTLSAIAKGAGMIEPNMATMLCYVMTDAGISSADLKRFLKPAVADSFNRISVDGDMSTNDTVLLFANGAAGAKVGYGTPDGDRFAAALLALLQKLAWLMVRDGEGADKVVKIVVTGAKTGRDAEAVARAVANSLLVKTSWHRDNPNWGRIMDAIGYAGARVVESKVDMSYDGLLAVRGGERTDMPLERLKQVQRKESFEIAINLNLGTGASWVYGCDCAHKYIDINI